MTPQHETLGQRIRRLRKARRWTQVELAVEIGMGHYHTVLRWERGEDRITAERFAQLAQALGVSMDELYYGNRQTDG